MSANRNINTPSSLIKEHNGIKYIDAKDILKSGGESLIIKHEKGDYQLKLTKNNKLLLVK